MMTAAAGWYADPTDASSVRWWDGERWTADTRPAPASHESSVPEPAAVPVPAPSPAPQPVAEQSFERELVGAGVGASGASLAAGAVYAEAVTTDVGPVPVLEPRHAPPAPVTAFAGTTLSPDQGAVPSLAPAPAQAATAPVMATPAPAQAFAPQPTEVDRSRPGAPLPETVHVPRTTGYAAPLDVSQLPTTAAAPSHVVRHGGGGGGGGIGGAAAFNVMASSGGFASEPSSGGHAVAYRPSSHWKRTLVVVVLVLAVIAGGAAIGVPRFLDSKAAAAAASAPQILPAKSPAAYAGARRAAAVGSPMSNLASRLSTNGAAWTWTQAYRSNDATSVVLAGSLGTTDRALAYRALTDHKKAMELVDGVVADVSSGTRDVPGQPVQYLSPVGGSIWCLPYASDGMGGGLCVWTNGGQLLVARTLPGVADSAAHTMLAELASLGKQASK
jgi:hypothetical protein